jgi:hypothetical protein
LAAKSTIIYLRTSESAPPQRARLERPKDVGADFLQEPSTNVTTYSISLSGGRGV